MVSRYVPNATVVATLIVTDEALKTTGLILNSAVTPAGRLSATRVMGAAKLSRVTPRRTIPDPPGAIVTPVPVPVMLYVPTAVIVRVTFCETDATPLADACTVSVYDPGAVAAAATNKIDPANTVPLPCGWLIVLVTPAGVPESVTLTAPLKFTRATESASCTCPPCGIDDEFGPTANWITPCGVGFGFWFGPVPVFDPPPPHATSAMPAAQRIQRLVVAY
jgi:hypothetical protein